tara:strand:+ start:324 stop:1313 length:990 start_codon:yes stop_codon:yes gene_type:complete
MVNEKFTLILSRPFGFFTNFFHTLQGLYDAELENRIPVIYWRRGPYMETENFYNNRQTDNVWEYFFEPVSEYSFKQLCPDAEYLKYGDVKPNNQNIKVFQDFRYESLPSEPPDCWCKGFPPKNCLANPTKECRLFVNGLIKKYIKLNPCVEEKIERFYSEYMKNEEVIGVHVRGCADQKGAQGSKPLLRYVKCIEEYVRKYPKIKILVATDSNRSLNYIKKHFGESVIAYDAIRSDTDELWSYRTLGKIRIRLTRGKMLRGAKAGEDVLIESILLSKCRCFFHGWSNVASSVYFFNPNVRTVFVLKYKGKNRRILGIKKGELNQQNIAE